MPASYRPLYILFGSISQILSSILSLCKIRPGRSIALLRVNCQRAVYSRGFLRMSGATGYLKGALIPMVKLVT
ncbi:uncharacterized protein K489DRAFT_140623 [Dissoconium aciculare CBS 342.82]|uniref:Uncharacterized protein n=1 Tax=Dissoconium aciculare CBS 342.82 TaxID=1314786 RepID=A0A6J3LPF5_9PEZI|nr:uncharacterized protein K489DRAFT_140623 [Dissoconium aciculare CBS 342.82]KAF1817831.1 hypothetical protein K489DRAFT_140623 [Dissoconium aciculare CBS 342.82]